MLLCRCGIRCAEQAHEVRLPAKYIDVLPDTPPDVRQKAKMVRFFACAAHEKKITEDFDVILAEKKRADDVQFG